jgi:hypothetical protein
MAIVNIQKTDGHLLTSIRDTRTYLQQTTEKFDFLSVKHGYMHKVGRCVTDTGSLWGNEDLQLPITN